MRKTTNKAWKGRTFGSALGIILFALVLLAGSAGATTPIVGATQFFNIILNQIVNVTWYVNGADAMAGGL